MPTLNVLWLDYSKPGLCVACVLPDGTIWNNVTQAWEPFPKMGIPSGDHLLKARPFFVGGPQFGVTASLMICDIPDAVSMIESVAYLILAPNWDGTLGRLGIRLLVDLAGGYYG